MLVSGGGCLEVDVDDVVVVVVELETGMGAASFVSLSLSVSLSFGGFSRSSHVLRSSCNLCFYISASCWYRVGRDSEEKGTV